MRLDNDQHTGILNKLDGSMADMNKKLKEYQLGKADAKQVQALMEKVGMFKTQLEEYRDKIAELNKILNMGDDIQLLKVKIDQA